MQTLKVLDNCKENSVADPVGSGSGAGYGNKMNLDPDPYSSRYVIFQKYSFGKIIFGSYILSIARCSNQVKKGIPILSAQNYEGIPI